MKNGSESLGAPPGDSPIATGAGSGVASSVPAARGCSHCGASLADGRAFVSRDGKRTICRDCFEARRARAHRRVRLREQLVRVLVGLLVATALVAVTFWFIGQQKPPRRRPPTRPTRQRTGLTIPAPAQGNSFALLPLLRHSGRGRMGA